MKEVKEDKKTIQPVMIAKCPNCHFTDKIESFNIFWRELEDGKSKRIKICPECGVVFANNIRYIDNELHRVAEGFGLIGRKKAFSK